jgi:RNA recognition motif-containing protein
VTVQPGISHQLQQLGGLNLARLTTRMCPGRQGNLDPRLTELDMATAFEQYGTIVDLSMPTDKKTGENKGYCFLQYQDSRSCDLAFNNMKG